MKQAKTVLGKDLIISEKMFKKILRTVFDEPGLRIHDVFHEPNVGIHIKVAKIGSSRNLRNQGFEEVVDVSDYPVKETIDKRLEQLFQCEAILDKEW